MTTFWNTIAFGVCIGTLVSASSAARAGAIDDWIESTFRIVRDVNRVKIGTEFSAGNGIVPEELLSTLNREIDQLHSERYSKFEGSEGDYAITVHAWVEAGEIDELDRVIARAKRRIIEERILSERILQIEERLEQASEAIQLARDLTNALEEIVSGPGAGIDALIGRRLAHTLIELEVEVIPKLSDVKSELRRVHQDANSRLEALAAHNEQVQPLVQILEEVRERRRAQSPRYSSTGSSGRLTQATMTNVIAKMPAEIGDERENVQGGALTQTQVPVHTPEPPPLPTLIDSTSDGMPKPSEGEETFKLPLPYTNPFEPRPHKPPVQPEQGSISAEKLL